MRVKSTKITPRKCKDPKRYAAEIVKIKDANAERVSLKSQKTCFESCITIISVINTSIFAKIIPSYYYS